MGPRSSRKLDIASGYHQIGIEKGSIEKTAFDTNVGNWKFVMVSFRLCHAPATFQTHVNKTVAEELSYFVHVYPLDFGPHIIVTADVIDVAVGIILMEESGQGLQPVALATTKLNNTKTRYSAYKRELLGIT